MFNEIPRVPKDEAVTANKYNKLASKYERLADSYKENLTAFGYALAKLPPDMEISGHEHLGPVNEYVEWVVFLLSHPEKW